MEPATNASILQNEEGTSVIAGLEALVDAGKSHELPFIQRELHKLVFFCMLFLFFGTSGWQPQKIFLCVVVTSFHCDSFFFQTSPPFGFSPRCTPVPSRSTVFFLQLLSK